MVSSFSVLVLESYYLKAEKECNRKYKKISVRQHRMVKINNLKFWLKVVNKKCIRIYIFFLKNKRYHYNIWKGSLWIHVAYFFFNSIFDFFFFTISSFNWNLRLMMSLVYLLHHYLGFKKNILVSSWCSISQKKKINFVVYKKLK